MMTEWARHVAQGGSGTTELNMETFITLTKRRGYEICLSHSGEF